ncbi:MAG: FHA domain-containing protein [Planctomycetota bacterium]|jgi:predicted component of type VI protein secretion system
MQVSLKVLSGNHEGKVIQIKDEKFLVGRSDSCQLRPKSDSVSRRHCAIVQKDGRVLLLDLKSRNGTFVNEKQLSPDKAKILKSGDKIRIGQLEFEIAIEVGLSGVKKPEVSSVKEAAERSSEQKSMLDSRESFDIASWLLEADQIDRRVPTLDPETRQFRAEDTTFVEVEQLDSDKSEQPESASASGESTEESKSEDTKAKRPDKKGPIKLPKASTAPVTKNTKEAASETLKKYFGGR